MLREVTHAVQYEKPRRRWFTSAYFDLIVWYGRDNDIVGFELCYGKPYTESAFCWLDGKGYAHFTVDDGEHEPFKHKMAPVFVNDEKLDKHGLSRAFFFESLMIDREVRDYVLQKIDACSFPS